MLTTGVGMCYADEFSYISIVVRGSLYPSASFVNLRWPGFTTDWFMRAGAVAIPESSAS